MLRWFQRLGSSQNTRVKSEDEQDNNVAQDGTTSDNIAVLARNSKDMGEMQSRNSFVDEETPSKPPTEKASKKSRKKSKEAAKAKELQSLHSEVANGAVTCEGDLELHPDVEDPAQAAISGVGTQIENDGTMETMPSSHEKEKTNGGVRKKKKKSRRQSNADPAAEEGAMADNGIEGEEAATLLNVAMASINTAKPKKSRKSRQAAGDTDVTLDINALENDIVVEMAAPLESAAVESPQIPLKIKKRKGKSKKSSDGLFTKQDDSQVTNFASSSQVMMGTQPSILSPEPVDAAEVSLRSPSTNLGKRKAISESLSEQRETKKKKRSGDKDTNADKGDMFKTIPQTSEASKSRVPFDELHIGSAASLGEFARNAYAWDETQGDRTDAMPDSSLQLPTTSTSSRKSAKKPKLVTNSWTTMNTGTEPKSESKDEKEIYKPAPALETAAELEIALEPSPEAPSSNTRRKRRLPTGEDDDDVSIKPKKKNMLQKSTQSKPNTPKSSSSVGSARKPRLTTTHKGKLTEAEIRAVSDAVETYRVIHDLTDREMSDLIQRDAGLTDSRALWTSICEETPDIPRRNVLSLCRRTFHNFEARGSFTPEQDADLRLAYEQFPGQWKKIGHVINRFPEDARDRWRNYLICGDNLKKSYWDKDEERKLKMVVRQCVDKVRERNRHDPMIASANDDTLIDWQKVSEEMGGTRSRLQCIKKWKQLKDREASDPEDPAAKAPISESWRLGEASKKSRDISAAEKLKLLYSIRDSGAGREGKIPWARIANQELDSRGKLMTWKVCYRKLKNKVPGHDDMKLQEIVHDLIDSFEASAPDEPDGFAEPTSSRVKRRKNTKDSKLSNEYAVEDEVEPEQDAEPKPKKRKIRAKMKKQGESQESAEEGIASGANDDDISATLELLKTPRETGSRRTKWKSRKNQLLSEKFIEDESDDSRQQLGEADDTHPIEAETFVDRDEDVNLTDDMEDDESCPNEDGMDVDRDGDSNDADPLEEEDESPEDRAGYDLERDSTDDGEEHAITLNGFPQNGAHFDESSASEDEARQPIYHDKSSPDLDTPHHDSERDLSPDLDLRESWEDLRVPPRERGDSILGSSLASDSDSDSGSDMSDVPARRHVYVGRKVVGEEVREGSVDLDA